MGEGTAEERRRMVLRCGHGARRRRAGGRRAADREGPLGGEGGRERAREVARAGWARRMGHGRKRRKAEEKGFLTNSNFWSFNNFKNRINSFWF